MLSEAAGGSSRAPMVPLAVCCLTMFIIVLDTSMMNVAVPTIVRDLDTDVSSVQAAISLYSVVMAALMITGGKLGDLLGVRRVFTGALLLYASGTILAALSWSAASLMVGWSVIEGVAAAALLPLTMTMLVLNFHGPQRALAFGVIGGVQAAAAAVGPIFGGVLTAWASWRWGFAFEVLIVLVILPLVPRLKTSPARRDQSLDLIGAGFSALGLVSIALAALLAGRYGWWAPRRSFTVAGETLTLPFGLAPTPMLLGLGVSLLVVLVLWQQRRERVGRTPLFRPRLIRNGTFVTGFTANALQSVTLAGLLFVLPFFLQTTLGYDALGAGVALLPLCVSVFAVSILAPRLGKHVEPRLLALGGLTLMLVGALLISDALTVDMSAWDLFAPLTVFGAGTGLMLSQIGNLTLSAVNPDETPEASGIQNTFKETGTSLGTALIGSVLLVSSIGAFTDGVLKESGTRVTPQERAALVLQIEDADQQLDETGRQRLSARLDAVTGGKLERISAAAGVDAARNALDITAAIILLALLVAAFLPRGRLGQPATEPTAGLLPDRRAGPSPDRGT